MRSVSRARSVPPAENFHFALLIGTRLRKFPLRATRYAIPSIPQDISADFLEERKNGRFMGFEIRGKLKVKKLEFMDFS